MLRGAPKFQLWRAAGAILPSVCTDPTSADSGPTLVFIREWRHGHRRHFSTDRIGSGNTGLQNTAQIRLKMISLSLDGTYSNPPARLGILTGETTGLVWSGLVFRRDPPRTGPFPGSPKLRRMDRPLKQPGIHLKTPPFSALNRSWSCQWAVSNPGPGVPMAGSTSGERKSLSTPSEKGTTRRLDLGGLTSTPTAAAVILRCMLPTRCAVMNYTGDVE